MGQYGTILSSSDLEEQVTKDLYKSYVDEYGRNKWSQMYLATDIAGLQATSALKQNFAKNIGSTYRDYLGQRSAIYSSNLGTGYKQAEIEDVNSALEEAYNSYLSNYQTNLQKVQNNVADSEQSISNLFTTTATQQSNYIADYANSTIEYLKYLDEQLGFEKLTAANKAFGNFYSDDGMLLDDAGLRNLLFEYDTAGNETLGALGMQYFDLLQNYYQDQYSFGNYLRANSSELFDWASTVNEFTGKTGRQSFNELIGLDPNKYYTAVDDLRYASKMEIDNLFTDFENVAITADNIDDLLKPVTELAQTYNLSVSFDTNALLKVKAELTDAERNAEIAVNNYKDFAESGTTDFAKLSELQNVAKTANQRVASLKQSIEKQYNDYVSSVKAAAQAVRTSAGYNKKDVVKSTGKQISEQTTSAGKQYSTTTSSGDKLTYIPTVAVGNWNIKDKKNKNAAIEYNGEKFKVEMLGDEHVLSEDDANSANRLIEQSSGAAPSTGSIVQYKGGLYILTEAGTWRGIKDRHGTGNKLLDTITATS